MQITNTLRIFLSILFFLISIIIYFSKNKLLESVENSKSHIFKKKYRNIHEIRLWLIIFMFFIMGILALVTIK